MFRNRLEKVYRHLSKTARRQAITCYRLYDHDLPEAPFIIELYEGKVYVSEYKRHHPLTDEEHTAWLQQCLQAISSVTGIDTENIFVKLRKKKEGRTDQYEKLDEAGTEFAVEEGGLQFLVNLTDYLDTGLFLDHRTTRQMVREVAGGKRVLNLFCYTGSFSVYAAAGGAAQVCSVDLSNTYIRWAERNMKLNFPEYGAATFVQADVLQYLQTLPPESYDLIILDPPTFSNSKRMHHFFDIQQHHVPLINDCLRLLTGGGGLLYFSTNYTKFMLDAGAINATEIKDITKATTPFDFVGKLHRQCFKLTK